MRLSGVKRSFTSVSETAVKLNSTWTPCHSLMNCSFKSKSGSSRECNDEQNKHKSNSISIQAVFGISNQPSCSNLEEKFSSQFCKPTNLIFDLAQNCSWNWTPLLNCPTIETFMQHGNNLIWFCRTTQLNTSTLWRIPWFGIPEVFLMWNNKLFDSEFRGVRHLMQAFREWSENSITLAPL